MCAETVALKRSPGYSGACTIDTTMPADSRAGWSGAAVNVTSPATTLAISAPLYSTLTVTSADPAELNQAVGKVSVHSPTPAIVMDSAHAVLVR